MKNSIAFVALLLAGCEGVNIQEEFTAYEQADNCEVEGTAGDFTVYEQTDHWAVCCSSFGSDPITVDLTKAEPSSPETPLASNVGYGSVCVTQDNGILAPAYLSPGRYSFEASGADRCMRCDSATGSLRL